MAVGSDKKGYQNLYIYSTSAHYKYSLAERFQNTKSFEIIMGHRVRDVLYVRRVNYETTGCFWFSSWYGESSVILKATLHPHLGVTLQAFN